MEREKPRHRIQERDFIPGIYNYCDRWCERCTMTSRCLVFAQEQVDPLPDLEAQSSNEAFWGRLRQSLALSMDLIEETAREMGIDLHNLDIDHDAMEQIDQAVGKHVLLLQTDVYMNLVDDWFKNAPQGHAGMEEKELQDVILYYAPFIAAKLNRALHGLLEAGPGDEHVWFDVNGSAKAALIAIERSIAAWWKMGRHRPGRRAAVRDVLVRLESMRRFLERTFPGARSFVRPGFDEKTA